MRKLCSLVAAMLVATTVQTAALASDDSDPRPGASGVGDEYFPLDGNGGYDVQLYDLEIRYQPRTGVLAGLATISARTTKSLSSFNLDLVGLTVRGIRVNGEAASWSRDGQELRVVPAHPLRKHTAFKVKVRYDGVPEPIESGLGDSGFLATDDGFDIAGQPHVAATWFPVNDHPVDKASYLFRVTAPRGREVVANGDLVGVRARGHWSTWTWWAKDPMASYLATVDVGEFRLDKYKEDGIRYVDAVDPDLDAPVAPPTSGTQLAISQQANNSYKRLLHTVTVPAGGATVGFTITRDTELDWDYVFAEIHTLGEEDWTTLPDTNGHTTQETGNSCVIWPFIHPFISHYQSSDQATGECGPTGTTGEWWAATGKSDGPEQWELDLGDYAGSTVELSITYASDDFIQRNGAFVDDIVVSTGEGTTSFETGLEGWIVPGAPAGSPGNENDWLVGTVADLPPSIGEIVDGSLARQPEIIGFLAGVFGQYPWRSAGGIVDDLKGLGFALETQTRPIYSRDFFTDSFAGDAVVVHELAHQWVGDSLALERWRDIWLNEGFATYSEWLWSEKEGLGTAQQIFDFFYNNFIPDDDPQWQVVIGDPGPDLLFEFPVYFRGALTLHQLRLTVGDEDFFRILRTWAQVRAGDNVTTPEFIRLAERISGEELDELFDAYLYTPGKPPLLAGPPAASRLSEKTAPLGAAGTIARGKMAQSSQKR